MYDFLELYVAHQAPIINSAVIKAAAPVIYDEAMGLPKTDVVTLPADPVQEQPTYESALSAFEALPEVRVLFDNGAGTSPTGSTTAGDPYPGFEDSFSSYPIPGTTAQTWYFGPGGTLNEQQPSIRGTDSDSYTSNAAALPPTDFSSNTGTGGLWGNASQWEWNWVQPPAGSAVSYVSAPLSDRHHRHRRRRREPVGQVLDPGCGPPGNGQRSASRRQRNVRAERLDAGQRAQARHQARKHPQGAAHAARTDPHDARQERAADAGGQVRAGRDPAVLRGTRLPGGLADQGHDLRRPTGPSRSGRSARPSRRAAPRRCRSPSRPRSRRA